MYTDTHDQQVVSCTTTTAGHKAAVISGAQAKLRLVVSQFPALLSNLRGNLKSVNHSHILPTAELRGYCL